MLILWAQVELNVKSVKTLTPCGREAQVQAQVNLSCSTFKYIQFKYFQAGLHNILQIYSYHNNTDFAISVSQRMNGLQ